MTGAGAHLAHPGSRLLARAHALALERSSDAIDPARIALLGPTADGANAVTPVPARTTTEPVLVLSWIGVHPDAREALLQRLWELEEAARAAVPRVLVLRFAPVVGPGSPLVALLAQSPKLDARLERSLVQPVHESDVVEGLAQLLAGRVDWHGWYEVCGSVPLTVGELARYSAAGAFGRVEARAAWEPAPGVLRAQGMVEWEPWAEVTGVTPRRLSANAEAPA